VAGTNFPAQFFSSAEPPLIFPWRFFSAKFSHASPRRRVGTVFQRKNANFRRRAAPEKLCFAAAASNGVPAQKREFSTSRRDGQILLRSCG